MSDNPLLRALRELLFRAGQRYTEHELIKLMVSRGLLPPDFNRRPVLLFQAHFALFNALYQLQDELVQRDLYLSIGLVEVRIEPVRAGGGRQLGKAGEARLREYYLDWTHFEAATDESVTSLLDDFWQQLGRQPIPEGDREQALAIFALHEPVTYPEVKKRYRRLAMDAHPDRGGDTEQLQSINWAMGVLERAYGAG